MNAEQSIVYAEHLGREFGETTALHDVSFAVSHGEIFGMVGPDGAGKTTTMRILAGILEPTRGDAWIDGLSVRSAARDVKARIAYMPQRFGLYEDLSVMENLVFYADLFRVPGRERRERMKRLFVFSRLEPFIDRPAGALSGGMKQKLALTCALIHSPRLLLLDEPTNGVDPVSRRDFWKILYDLLHQGISIVVTTAYLDEAERTNRVGLMHHGRMIHQGRPNQIKELVKGRFFEVVVDDVHTAGETLTGRTDVIDVHVFGEGIHVRLNPAADPDRIREALEGDGINIESLREIPPGMEDAFLSLIRRHEGEAGERE